MGPWPIGPSWSKHLNSFCRAPPPSSGTPSGSANIIELMDTLSEWGISYKSVTEPIDTGHHRSFGRIRPRDDGMQTVKGSGDVKLSHA